jgi:hypothetical protein
MSIKRAIDVGPVWLLAGIAIWQAALAIAGTTALVRGGWDAGHANFTLDRAFWALGCAYVAYLMHDNLRLHHERSGR